jgi:hypothetical protein
MISLFTIPSSNYNKESLETGSQNQKQTHIALLSCGKDIKGLGVKVEIETNLREGELSLKHRPPLHFNVSSWSFSHF